MYAIVNHLQFSKPVDDFKEIVLNDGMPFLSTHAGFIDFHFIKVDEYKAIVLIIWDNAASAQAGAKSFGPTWFATHFKPFLVGEENRSTGELIASTYKTQ